MVIRHCNTRRKRVNAAIILSRRNTSFYAIFHSGSLFTCFYMGCIIRNTRSKRVKEEILLYFVLLSRRKTSFYAKFQIHCSHLSPVFTWLWPAFLSGLSLKPEVTGLTTNSVTVHY